MAATTVRIANFMGTGIDLLPLPLTGYKQVDWAPFDATVSNVSPYTRQEQVQAYLGGEGWACTVTLPELNVTDVANWTSKLLATRGTVHAFQIANQLYQGPQNFSAIQGARPSVDGSTSTTNAAGTTTLATGGWSPNTYAVLENGDFFQVGQNMQGGIGYRYYMVIDTVSSDVNGKAQIVVWPSLRENHASGQLLDIVSPVCLMRRADNTLKWSTGTNKTASLSFQCVECR